MESVSLQVELGFQFIDHISTSKFLHKVVSPFFNGTQWTGRDLINVLSEYSRCHLKIQ